MNASVDSMTALEIDIALQKKAQEMTEHTRNSNYMEAENCRVSVDQLKRDYDARLFYELHQKQIKEKEEI